VPNKATGDVKELARKFVPEVIAELARLALHAASETARVTASKEILDRAYGKAPVAENFTFIEALKNIDKLSDFELAEILRIQQEIIAVTEARVAQPDLRGNGLIGQLAVPHTPQAR
jgi:hypothetical protein